MKYTIITIVIMYVLQVNVPLCLIINKCLLKIPDDLACIL